MYRPRSGLLGPRSPRYPALKAYLMARPKGSLLPVRADRAGMLAGGVMGASLALAGPLGHQPWVGALGLAITGTFGFLFLRDRKPPAPPTPEEELARKADAVVRKIDHQVEFNRLHRVFHPAVAATLEECAVFHARIVASLERWEASELREAARLAAKVAMDEAVVKAGETLPYVAPARPLEQLSDTLEDIGFGPIARDGREHEPMPPAFRPVREIAERLRELATRCETALMESRAEEPASTAFRHLDAALGEMRVRQEAESELRQGA